MEIINANYNNEIYNPVMLSNPTEITKAVSINYSQIAANNNDSTIILCISLLFFVASLYISYRNKKNAQYLQALEILTQND